MNMFEEIKTYIGQTVTFDNGKNPQGRFEIHSISALITIDANGEKINQIYLTDKNNNGFSIQNCKIVLPLNLKDARYEIH